MVSSSLGLFQRYQYVEVKFKIFRCDFYGRIDRFIYQILSIGSSQRAR